MERRSINPVTIIIFIIIVYFSGLCQVTPSMCNEHIFLEEYKKDFIREYLQERRHVEQRREVTENDVTKLIASFNNF